MLALELALAPGVLGLGRRLELRLRVAFLSKIPRLGDRYFQSRPTSDMAERGHVAAHPPRRPRARGTDRARRRRARPHGRGARLDRSPERAPAAAIAALSADRPPRRAPCPRRAGSARPHPRRARWPASTSTLCSASFPSARTGPSGPCAGSTRACSGSGRARGARCSARRSRRRARQALLGAAMAAFLLFDHVAREGAAGSGPASSSYWALALPARGQELAAGIQQVPCSSGTSRCGCWNRSALPTTWTPLPRLVARSLAGRCLPRVPSPSKG